MRVGVLILPEHRWPAAAEKWIRAETLGFDHVWTYDHIAWRDLRDSTWFASMPTLAAAAAVTSRIRLGTLVASPNFRHPVPFARELLTLDDMVVFETVTPFRGVRVEGVATLLRDGGSEVRAAIASRYLGAEEGQRYVEQGRPAAVVVRLKADRAQAWDLSAILPA